MNEAQLTNEFQRLAERYAAELIDKLGVPQSYDAAVTMIGVAWLEGGAEQLKWARDNVRGDGI